MARNSRFWRDFPMHSVNALGICAFVGYMRHWPYFYDSGPPIEWLGLFKVILLDAVWLYVPFVLLDMLPAFVFTRERGPLVRHFLQPISSAAIFGSLAVVFFYVGVVLGNLHGQRLPFLGSQNAEEAGSFFLLHFLPIFLFESATRAVWLYLTRSEGVRVKT